MPRRNQRAKNGGKRFQLHPSRCGCGPCRAKRAHLDKRKKAA